MRILYLLLGHLAVGLGVLGVFLPLLPTTPFILLAGYFYARSCERFHQWILNHRRFGPLARQWEQHGVIPPRAKLLSVSMMLLFVSYPLIAGQFHWGLKACIVATVLFALWFILSRPSAPPTPGPVVVES